MPPWIRSIFMLALMLSASGLAVSLRPHHRLADDASKVKLETVIPKDFGDWRALDHANGKVVNPQQADVLNRIYSQTLSRIYVNSKGAVIMLSIAYGVDQSDGLALHYPEVCYPVQGFQVLSTQTASLETSLGPIRVKRLMTRLDDRSEPVTYWTTLGNQIVRGGMETKLAQLKYGFQGIIPDGLLIRVSSIDKQLDEAYALQAQFAAEMVAAIPAEFQPRFSGSGMTGANIPKSWR